MANATVLSVGQVNNAGATDALFLKLWGGEVLTAFEENTVAKDWQQSRTIASGKSSQFPATWKVSAGYHVPGTEIVGQTSPLAERIINVDDILYASVFLADIDQAKTHYEVRGEYAKQCGLALAYQYDKNVLQVMALAARASATVTGGIGGTQFTSATTLYKTSATDLAAGIYAAAQKFDDNFIPESEEKMAFVKPAQYYLLVQSTNLINRDWNGMGSYADGNIQRIGGIGLRKAVHLPTTNIGSVSGQNNTYAGDFTKTAAIITTRSAVGTVQLMGLNTWSGFDGRRMGTLMWARYAIGTGILRPECAIELLTTS